MPAFRSGLSASVLSSMVTVTAGTGDESFNDLAKEGGDRAAEELGIEFNVLESQTAADYVRNLIRARGAGMAASSGGASGSQSSDRGNKPRQPIGWIAIISLAAE